MLFTHALSSINAFHSLINSLRNTMQSTGTVIARGAQASNKVPKIISDSISSNNLYLLALAWGRGVSPKF
jgi:hypothetical protein